MTFETPDWETKYGVLCTTNRPPVLYVESTPILLLWATLPDLKWTEEVFQKFLQVDGGACPVSGTAAYNTQSEYSVLQQTALLFYT
jgi:hypothetical protein